ncbi:ankyrin repeat-containing protein NPR4-like [Forsythia ovata]|uniref:Ankyrin repeat-containing protein NPR4-like n=1 Tax=Forsythia ovata TaxID=205694 RepID=A0ABD1P5A1_9LAMI
MQEFRLIDKGELAPLYELVETILQCQLHLITSISYIFVAAKYKLKAEKMETSSTMQTDQPVVEETLDTYPFLFIDRNKELSALQQTPQFFAPPPAGPLQLSSPPLDPFQLPQPPLGPLQPPSPPFGPLQLPPLPLDPLQPPPPPLRPLQPSTPPPGFLQPPPRPPLGPLQPPTPPSGIEVNLNYYQPLHLAAKEGDWKTAKRFIDSDNTALTAVISVQGMTALHVAASSSHSKFIENLVELIPAEALDARDKVGCNALHYVAIGEAVNAAKALVNKNPALPLSMETFGQTPLFFAAYWGAHSKSKEMLWYLSTVTTNDFPSCPFTGPWSSTLILGIAAAGFNGKLMKRLKLEHPQQKALFSPRGKGSEQEDRCQRALHPDLVGGHSWQWLVKITPSKLLPMVVVKANCWWLQTMIGCRFGP